jgi:hypothetical protein
VLLTESVLTAYTLVQCYHVIFLFIWPELLVACALPGLASGQVLHHLVCFPKHVSCHFAAAKQVG